MERHLENLGNPIFYKCRILRKTLRLKRSVLNISFSHSCILGRHSIHICCFLHSLHCAFSSVSCICRILHPLLSSPYNLLCSHHLISLLTISTIFFPSALPLSFAITLPITAFKGIPLFSSIIFFISFSSSASLICA